MRRKYKLRSDVHELLVKSGLLPDNLDNLNEQQKQVYEFHTITKKGRTFDTLKNFLPLCNEWGLKFFFYKKIQTIKYEKDLQIEDIQINRVCPFFKSELDFTFKSRRRSKFYPSIDRIDSTKGYVTGNVWVVSELANTIKNASTNEELRSFSTAILKRSIEKRVS